MLLTSLALLAAFSSALAQSINGMWSSGSQHVLTGPGFAVPQSFSFTVPNTTGISWSFDVSNGAWESSRFRMTGNGKNPGCGTTTVFWAHGTYAQQTNGSYNCTVLEGYQLIQNACAATSSFTEMYNQSYEFYDSIQLVQDASGLYLQMYGWDGAPVPPMGQVSQTPNMFPVAKIINNNRTKVLAALSTTNGALRVHPWDVAVAATVGVLLGSAFLIT